MYPNNKYRAKKTKLDGLVFDSRMEADRWAVLRLLEKRGLIRDLSRQARFEIVPKTPRNRAHFYTVDFVYYENGGMIAEEVKGYPDAGYKLRRALFIARHPEILFREYTKEGIRDI
jgi:hypothetical protein